MISSHFHPAPWLQQLAQLKRGRWFWGKAIRAAICVGGPLAVGLATGGLDVALWVCMGAMLMSAGESMGTYPSLFRQTAISGLIGAAGFLAGYLMVIPYPMVICIMMVLSFLGGIISSYGMRFSLASMQALITATIAIGMPEVGSYWQSSLLYLAGIGLYALALAIEVLVNKRRPERQMLSDLFLALAQLAEMRAQETGSADESSAFQQVRRTVTDQSSALYAALIGSRRQGRTLEATSNAAILDAADAVFSAILGASQSDGAVLVRTAAALRNIAAGVQSRKDAPVVEEDGSGTSMLEHSLRHLSQTLRSGGVVSKDNMGATRDMPVPKLSELVAQLVVGRDVVITSLALALSMGVAFSMRYLIEGSHWYWVPLTVSIVVKPDLGSVFARAILRAAGTVIGVVIGTGLLILLPKGPILVIAIAALAATMSWAKQVSYAVQTLVLTPLMLVLLDLLSPSLLGADYAGQRLVDTLWGSAIAIIFGYFIWPRSHEGQLATAFGEAMAAVADFLTATCSPADVVQSRIGSTRRTAYALLSNLRAALQRCMAEPGAVGAEAAAWFPLIAGAERLCDRITAYAADRKPDDPLPSAEAVTLAAERMRMLGQAGANKARPCQDAPTNFIASIDDDTWRLSQMLGDVTSHRPRR